MGLGSHKLPACIPTRPHLEAGPLRCRTPELAKSSPGRTDGLLEAGARPSEGGRQMGKLRLQEQRHGSLSLWLQPG